MSKVKRLAVVVTHPIQYYVPMFKLLARSINIKVFYTRGQQIEQQYDVGFNRSFSWDIPLLNGYDYVFLENSAQKKGTQYFDGIVNPTAVKEIKAYQPHAILIYGWAYQSHLKMIRYFKGKIPVYFRGDSTLIDNQFGIKAILKKMFLLWVYHHIDLAFYVGQKNRDYFKHYGLNDKQLTFSPHAVDNDRFSENRANEAYALRELLEIAEQDILILFAGKFEKKKNPEILLSSFIELNLPNVHLLFVGNGELEEGLKLKVERLKDIDVIRQAHDDNIGEDSRLKVEDLEKSKDLRQAQNDSIEVDIKFKVEDLENSKVLRQAQYDKESLEFIPPSSPFRRGQSKTLKERIHFMDFQNQTQMPAIYQACDLFCLPSKGPGETWGLAVNEAMASGKAILVSDRVGCSVDLVRPNVNGEIFRSDNLQDLKNKLINMLRDKNILIEYGKASKDIIQDWSLEKQVDSYLKSFNS